MTLHFSLRERAFGGALAALDFTSKCPETDEAIVTTQVVRLVAHVAMSNVGPFPHSCLPVLGALSMAVSGSELSSVPTYIRGYHDYQNIWSPFTGEVLPLKREPDNPKDSYVVAIKRTGRIVRHVYRRTHVSFNLTLEDLETNVWRK